jgi:UTP--glucose-1-phosphate uridylyltransferase
MSITKAIIPVAGWGTRRLPITKAIEKAMLPVGNRPLVDYVVQDCIVAGIRDIYFIVSGEKTQLEAYYSENIALNDYLLANNKADFIGDVTPPADVAFHYLIQPQGGKYGTAIPVSLIIPELEAGESIVVLMGDDFIYNHDGSSEVARLLNATPENGNAMLGVNVAPHEVSRYGVLELNDESEFVRIVEKPTPEEAPSTLINVSKYVLNYDLLQEIARYSASEKDGEYYITDPINDYVTSGGSIKVIPTQGQYLDGGSVESWLRANEVVVRGLSQ